MEGRKARRRQRLQRWEVLAQLGRHQLEELRGGPYVLQPMTPERTEGRAGKRLVAGDVADSPRHDDLLAVGGAQIRDGDDDVHADVALVASSGSPVCSPMRSRCASSSGHGSAASERWICAAAAAIASCAP